MRLWDAASGKLEQIFEAHTAGLNDVAWSPDSRTLATASDDKTIRTWDVKSVRLSSTNTDMLQVSLSRQCRAA
jgi:WD40 repeat protein